MPMTRRGILAGGALAGSAAALGAVAAAAQTSLPMPAPDSPAPSVDIAQLMVPGPLGDCALGASDAAVTLVEYASATCPHCA
ncbi:MAG: thioredoxin domain-containing protein, partial [Phreatobacter sp.]